MSQTSNFEEQQEKIVKILQTMLDYLGLVGTFRVEEKGPRIAVKISSDDAGRIIGRKGQTLDSLQLLLNRILFKEDDKAPHVLLDIDGYTRGGRLHGRGDDFSEEDSERVGHYSHERRERRRFRDEDNHNFIENLEKQALDAAKEVKRWGEAVKLPEMNAHDRRIIHVTLQNDPDVVTESEGEGAFKKVVISLKNA